MTPKWITSLVRARQVQEDAAQAEHANAQRAARTARRHVEREHARIDSLCESDLTTMTAVPAFVAAAVALQAAAATHAAAVGSSQRAELTAEDRRLELGQAARARAGAEDLAERSDALERARKARAAQLELDEIAARTHRDSLRRTP